MNEKNQNRWRLILGDFADDSLSLDGDSREMDHALGFLYQNEYGEASGVRQQGGRGNPVMSIPRWIGKVRTLFPKSTVEIMQQHALEKYNMTALLTDKQVLETMEPNMALLKDILAFKNIMPKDVMQTAHTIIQKVVRELTDKLSTQVKRSFYGKKQAGASSPVKIYRNLDVKRTIRHNLKNYDRERGSLVIDRVFFHANVRRYNPWDIVIAVDESGSMTDSVIYSAVMAGIFAKLPMLRTSLVIFDTQVVDLSARAGDPVEVLMSVQLGGGTNIQKALGYCRGLVKNPARTIVVLISDLYEGGGYREMYAQAKAIVEAGSRLFVLPALDYACDGAYDRQAARVLAGLGAQVAAITPEELTKWISTIIF